MEKGEIACFEQFLLLSLCFQKKLSAADASESDYKRERVNSCILVCEKKLNEKRTKNQTYLTFLTFKQTSVDASEEDVLSLI